MAAGFRYVHIQYVSASQNNFHDPFTWTRLCEQPVSVSTITTHITTESIRTAPPVKLAQRGAAWSLGAGGVLTSLPYNTFKPGWEDPEKPQSLQQQTLVTSAWRPRHRGWGVSSLRPFRHLHDIHYWYHLSENVILFITVLHQLKKRTKVIKSDLGLSLCVPLLKLGACVC